MIVIRRNGKTTMLTGWQAWLAGAVIVAGASGLLLLIAFILFGLAITITAVLFIAVPIAIVVGLLVSLIQSPRSR